MATISAEELSEFKKANAEALKQVLAIKDDSHWKLSKEEEDIVFYTRHEKSSSFSQVKAYVEFEAPFDKVMDEMNRLDPISPKEGKSGLTERSVLYGPDEEGNSVFYMSQKIPAPMIAPRDYLLFRKHYTIEEDGGAEVYIHNSIKCDQLKPEQKGVVRANLIFQCFMAQKLEGNKVRLTLIAFCDPCGSMPSFAFNMAVTKQGYAVRGMRNNILESLK